jgi:hypothetical protein
MILEYDVEMILTWDFYQGGLSRSPREALTGSRFESIARHELWSAPSTSDLVQANVARCRVQTLLAMALVVEYSLLARGPCCFLAN